MLYFLKYDNDVIELSFDCQSHNRKKNPNKKEVYDKDLNKKYNNVTSELCACVLMSVYV